MPVDIERPAVFLDRDGTIIEDTGYPNDPAKVRLLPGAADAIRRLREAGFAAVVISNQSGVGRGLVTMRDLDRVHARTVELLAERGAALDGAYYCPHHPDDECDCRKPAPGLIHRARRELSLSASGCYFVGDKASDIEAGAAAGCETILLGPADAGGATPSWRASSWAEIVDRVAGSLR